MRWHVKIRDVEEAKQLYEFVERHTPLNLKGNILYFTAKGIDDTYETRPCTLTVIDGSVCYHGFCNLLTEVYSVSVQTFINNCEKRVTL